MHIIKIGWKTLKDEFGKFIEKAKCSKDHDDIFDKLKDSVLKEAIERHRWEDKAFEVLVSKSYFIGILFNA